MSALERDPILILGTGAMACLFGARLSRVAHVTLLGTWEEGLQALEREGIRLVESDGSEARYQVNVARETEPCMGSQLALALVKSWQTGRAAQQLKRCLAPEGIVLTLQNGLGNLEQIIEHVGEERAALGVTTTGGTLLGPAHVRIGGEGPTYVAEHPRLSPLTDLLTEAGFEIEQVDDLQGLQWAKLAVNCGINPLSAMLDVRNGALLELPGARNLMRALVQETVEVAHARGVILPFDDLSVETCNVAARTAQNLSSMVQDIHRGAPTEIDAICGAVVRAGEQLGIATPVNLALWDLVQARAALAGGEVG